MHFHTVFPGVANQLKGHLWSLDNLCHMDHTRWMCTFAYPCWENSAGWQSRFVVRWCRCNLHCPGSCQGRMVRSGCLLVCWNCLHMHQSYRSSEMYLLIHMQAEIHGHFQCSWRKIWGIGINEWEIFLSKCFVLLPNSQVVLSCLHGIRDIAAISTVSSNQWRFFRISIPHLNEIWWCCLTIYIHGDKGDVDICSVGLRDKVDTACQFWVGIWVWGWGQDSTFIWIVSSTCCD